MRRATASHPEAVIEGICILVHGGQARSRKQMAQHLTHMMELTQTALIIIEKKKEEVKKKRHIGRESEK